MSNGAVVTRQTSRDPVQFSAARQRVLGVQLLERYPGYAGVIGADAAMAFEAMHGADTDKAMASQGVYVGINTRGMVNFAMANHLASARQGLEARQVGDYGPVEALERASRNPARASSSRIPFVDRVAES